MPPSTYADGAFYPMTGINVTGDSDEELERKIRNASHGSPRWMAATAEQARRVTLAKPTPPPAAPRDPLWLKLLDIAVRLAGPIPGWIALLAG